MLAAVISYLLTDFRFAIESTMRAVFRFGSYESDMILLCEIIGKICEILIILVLEIY